MAGTSETAESLAPIRTALVSGTDVEDMIEAVLPEPEDAPANTFIGSLLRAVGRAPAPTPGPERLKQVADGLDRFSADLVQASRELDDAELAEAAARSQAWGSALWSDDIGIEDAYNELRHALVQLCRRRARLMIGRPIDIP